MKENMNLTHEQIIEVAEKTRTAESRDGDYILPISFAEAIVKANDEARTPAATTSGAAGTIDTPEFRKLLAREQGWANNIPVISTATKNFIAHIDQHTAAAVAAAREEAETRVAYWEEKADGYKGLWEGGKVSRDNLEARAKAAEAELARLRAAPVVGEAVANGDMLRDMLAIQEACGLHTDEYAPGSVIEYIKELEADTAPHAAKEAGKVGRPVQTYAYVNKEVAEELARTTNKENDRG